jgi:hypothetical protein
LLRNFETNKGKNRHSKVGRVANNLRNNVLHIPTKRSMWPRPAECRAAEPIILILQEARVSMKGFDRKQGPLSEWILCTLKGCITDCNNISVTCSDFLDFKGKINVKSVSSQLTISRWEYPSTVFKFSAKSRLISCMGKSGDG